VEAKHEFAKKIEGDFVEAISDNRQHTTHNSQERKAIANRGHPARAAGGQKKFVEDSKGVLAAKERTLQWRSKERTLQWLSEKKGDPFLF
jgi:hypothetical protein